jgi:hypothetical protein
MNQDPNTGELINLNDQQGIVNSQHQVTVSEIPTIGDLSEPIQTMQTIQQIPIQKQARTKRHFTYEEDNQIRALVEQHGTNQWPLIARSLQNRNARQVRDRWRCYLQPGVVKSEWTLEEDRLLIHLCSQIGKLWAQLVKFFPGRTDVDLKNHWNKLQRHAKKIQPGNTLLESPDLKLDEANVSEIIPVSADLQETKAEQ